MMFLWGWSEVMMLFAEFNFCVLFHGGEGSEKWNSILFGEELLYYGMRIICWWDERRWELILGKVGCLALGGNMN